MRFNCFLPLIPLFFLSNPSKAFVFYVADTADAGIGSLREAISAANISAGKDTIYFALPEAQNRTIRLLTSLPTITDPLVIDGTTQSTGNSFGNSNAKIFILGPSTELITAFEIRSSDCSITGLVVAEFLFAFYIVGSNINIGESGRGNVIIDNYFGIQIDSSLNVRVKGNRIGLDTSGNYGSNSVGIECNRSTGTVIGSGLPDEGNVISTNFSGIRTYEVDGMIVQGNLIGTDLTGTTGQGNHSPLYCQKSSNVLIGGSGIGEGNVIAANSLGSKVEYSEQITLQGNYFGTDKYGTTELSIDQGTLIINSDNCLIGGSNPGEGNIISGSNGTGIELEGKGNRIEGNHIGTDVSGTINFGNHSYGIAVSGLSSNNNKIGGEQPGAGNVIAYNGYEAIVFFCCGSSFNEIRSNSIFCNSQIAGNGGILFEGTINENIAAPIVLFATAQGIAGTAIPYSVVDIYTDDSCTFCEGKNLMGSVTTTNAGTWTLADTVQGSAVAQQTYNDNSSEFSNCKSATVSYDIVAGFHLENYYCADSTIYFFDGTVTAPGTNINSWFWDFGDGYYSTQKDPPHFYDHAGSFTVTLITGNDYGNFDTVSKPIEVFGIIEIDFTYIFIDSLTVEFSNTTLLNNYSLGIIWYFGDGDSANGFYPTHVFDSIGSYEVCLKIIMPYCPDTQIVCKIIDLSNTTVENVSLPIKVKVFPNPSNGHFRIHVPDFETVESLRFFTSDGRELHSYELQRSSNTEIAIEFGADTKGLIWILMHGETGASYHAVLIE